MIDETLAEREKTHGPYARHAAITQALKEILHGPWWASFSPTQKETIDMIAHKLGRICAGDPDFPDHYKDIAGYATLVAKELESHGKKDPA